MSTYVDQCIIAGFFPFVKAFSGKIVDDPSVVCRKPADAGAFHTREPSEGTKDKRIVHKGGTRPPFPVGFIYLAAAAAIIVAAAAIAIPGAAVVAAAAEQDQQDDDPAHIATETIVTHIEYLQIFSSG